MISNFDPYEELIATQQAVLSLEQLCNELIEAINAQAKLLEETAHTVKKSSQAHYQNTRKIQELNTTVAMAKNRLADLESRNKK